jgi:lysophospholipase L1-like esterase
MKSITPVVFLFLFQFNTVAQSKDSFTTWNPASAGFEYIGGQAWPETRQSPYDRLPAAAEQRVRKEVWNLSRHSAGLYVQFRTSSPTLQVQYTVSGEKAFPHMPATGVSGIDLYSRSGKGPWLWSAGRFSFKDTITYTFERLTSDSNRVYTLYFPLYNQVSWMEIKVPHDFSLDPLSVNKQKPIVVYGTSIAQGACASRPGLSWAALLGRAIEQPVVNLGFSGNGRLEPELIDRIAEIDASVYVLDCLPNMAAEIYVNGELRSRLEKSIQALQEKRPGTPLLLVDHAGLTGELTNPQLKNTYEKVNAILNEAYTQLKKKGVQNIYILKKKQLGQNIETMVDGIHPNDMGMVLYAKAYANMIRTILKRQ